jgi:hypothetical protein
MNELVCKLTTPELQKRRSTVIEGLKQVLLKKEVLDEGLRFTFPSEDDVLAQLIDFIKSERLCCDFLSFKLIIGANMPNIATLEITGPTGTQDFLEHEVGF